MNYTNPMSITCLVGIRASKLPIVGLCHSIPHTAEQLAEYLGIPRDEIQFRAAGVNHAAWLVELTRKGEDLYPLLREKAKPDNL
jgi:alpha-galactosidase